MMNVQIIRTVKTSALLIDTCTCTSYCTTTVKHIGTCMYVRQLKANEGTKVVMWSIMASFMLYVVDKYAWDFLHGKC